MTRRHVRAGLVLIAVVLAGAWWAPPPVAAQGMPPVIRFFAAWAESRSDFDGLHLFIDAQVDDPDGQVPLSIQSVIVTRPDGGTLDLTGNFRYPNLGFRGEYFVDAGAPAPGTYTIAVTDAQGNTAMTTDDLGDPPALAPPEVVTPASEQIVATTTPTIGWNPVDGTASQRVAIRNADAFNVFGDSLYTGPVLPGDAAQFTLPAGVLTPGRRYVVELQAYDVPSGILAQTNTRAVRRQPFSVAGPNVGFFLNQAAFTTGDTLNLGLSVRNDGPPVAVDVRAWAGPPSGPAVLVFDVPGVEFPATAPDVSTVLNNVITHVFTGDEPAGPYALGIRVLERDTGAVMAQSIVGFDFAP